MGKAGKMDPDRVGVKYGSLFIKVRLVLFDIFNK